MWADGTKYIGMFEENKQSGKGIKTWREDGKISQRYTGSFKSDKQNGKGKMVWRDGRTY